MPIETLSKKPSKKILTDIQHCDFSSLQALKVKDPHFHWSSVIYEKTGDTALHVAARLGHLTVIDYLLEEYAPQTVDVRNQNDKTPLHEAAQFGQWESVVKLLSYGAEVNALRRGDWTPLMLACTKIQPVINLKIVKLLVEKGAYINMPNKDGWTCVHILAREGGVDVLHYLINQGLNVCPKTKNGRTALHIAALHGNIEILDMVLEHLDINSKDSCGNTALHEGLLGQHVHVAKHLVSRGASTDCRNNSDFSVLHLAASQNNCEVMDYVLRELSFEINCQNSNGWSALHCAARKRNEKLERCDFESGNHQF
ncbi:ankyrin repeat domain-containing protein 16 isoform X2 [Dendroctonus ponderosae]|uniref:ankyrin repeat domain-containing protein 16 isoform X2 n=1 Tax=Dendroctonus ponderosae TaxID=77166 RepID=UPI0020364D9F|nr:ankyrin repeat domain-containing protein 16 isoform X2 [Dendroctonus ponderosae]